ncbi:uncharacterized protein LOC131522124 [Onychostoma macrolepis]|uniref:Septin-type G domain-containing protein n=1 Tax=Onychostoma macrolepis TaxID=369639 RepID=A0A7J6DCE8_9TELE|nr:uncharacterized protein LOC131522124 [Onychostoma macrolepis]KAF4116987.1 hypothetical protein G5714_001540 [Onychostoma macrolepis]
MVGGLVDRQAWVNGHRGKADCQRGVKAAKQEAGGILSLQNVRLTSTHGDNSTTNWQHKRERENNIKGKRAQGTDSSAAMHNNSRLFNSESNQTEKQHADFNGSRHDATQINSGPPPALYRLNTERKHIDGTDGKVRLWTYGRKDRNKKNKVILMVGETGAGKTTLINTMVNYLLGVKFEDEEWYVIAEAEEVHIDQTKSQTSELTVYEVFVEENPISLTIIDTPGYGHTEGYEKDKEIAEYLSKLFSAQDGIHYIDAVCFVMKASQNRLSGKEHYIFHSVLSLFGKDIENNIMFLLTHSDGGPPINALNAIKKAEIPCRRDEDNEPIHYLFNSQQKEKRNKRYEQNWKRTWEMGDENMNEFLTELKENNRKSVQLTLEVLIERRRLEACVSNLKDRISEKELKTQELTKIEEALRQNRDKIKKCENFVFTVERVFKEKVLIENESRWNRKATCCSDCQENCHVKGCWWANDLSWCEIMKNNHCTVCSGKCHYSKHVKENKKYELKTKEVQMSFYALKQEYECIGDEPEASFDRKTYADTKNEYEWIMKESENKTKIEEDLNRDLAKIKNEKSQLVQEAYTSIMNLSKIALKADSALTIQYMEFLIPRLREERKDAWIKDLEDLKKAGEDQKNKGVLHYMFQFTGGIWNQFWNQFWNPNK